MWCILLFLPFLTLSPLGVCGHCGARWGDVDGVGGAEMGQVVLVPHDGGGVAREGGAGEAEAPEARGDSLGAPVSVVRVAQVDLGGEGFDGQETVLDG